MKSQDGVLRNACIERLGGGGTTWLGQGAYGIFGIHSPASLCVSTI
jgi:hypothetical protein